MASGQWPVASSRKPEGAVSLAGRLAAASRASVVVPVSLKAAEGSTPPRGGVAQPPRIAASVSSSAACGWQRRGAAGCGAGASACASACACPRLTPCGPRVACGARSIQEPGHHGARGWVMPAPLCAAEHRARRPRAPEAFVCRPALAQGVGDLIERPIRSVVGHGGGRRRARCRALPTTEPPLVRWRDRGRAASIGCLVRNPRTAPEPWPWPRPWLSRAVVSTDPRRFLCIPKT